MIKQVLIATLAGVTLIGCASFQEFKAKVDTVLPSIETGIHIVSETTRRLCGFEPIAATIASAFTGGLASGPLEIAELICNAVRQQPVAAAVDKRRIPMTVVVKGVRIEGVVTPKNVTPKKGR